MRRLHWGVDERGRPFVRGHGSHTPACTLSPEGLIVAGGGASITCAWNEFGTFTRRPARSSWSVGPVTEGPEVGTGIGIHLRGDLIDRGRPLLQWALPLTRHPLLAFTQGPPEFRCVPIGTSRPAWRIDCWADRAMLRALCRLVHELPELRPRLDETHRSLRLVHDIERSPVGEPPVERTAITAEAMNVAVALQAAGYGSHRFGRPLRASDVVPLEEVVRAAHAALERNTHRVKAEIDDALITKYARHNYFDIEPWPFAALIDA